MTRTEFRFFENLFAMMTQWEKQEALVRLRQVMLP